MAHQVVHVFAGTQGYLDRIAVDRVEEFLEGLVDSVSADLGDTLDKIGEGEGKQESVAKYAESTPAEGE